MTHQAEAGRSGSDVRSDCRVSLTLRESGGREFHVTSKVDVLYGRANRALLTALCDHFDLPHVRVELEDSGALPYVLAARFEAAVRRLRPDDARRWRPPLNPRVHTTSSRDRFRRSRLYLPGNDPKLAINAGIHRPDAVILDLEDSVSPREKDAARILVRNTLRTVDFLGAEIMVRINQLPLGLTDLEEIVPESPHLLLVPKCETAEQVLAVHEAVEGLRQRHGLSEPIFLMPIIESAKGALNALAIATATPSVVALSIGLEDYTADIGAERTLEGRESQWMRGICLNAAKAAGIQAIDTVFSDVADMEGLRANVREAKALGFDGKGCIHPRQIPVVHEAFAPTAPEIEKARKIVLAFEDAEAKGLGVVSLGTKMIDPPVVKRAQKIMALAEQGGLVSSTWREEVSRV